MKLILSVLIATFTMSALAADYNDIGPIELAKKHFKRNRFENSIGFSKQSPAPESQAAVPGGDVDLVRAVKDQRNVDFVQGSNVTVSRILPDDTQGLEHERWYIQLSDGSVVFAVYNIDMNVERVPLVQGEKQDIGGQFIWTNNGGLLHWLHADPKNNRPDGFVIVNGHRYGDIK